MGSNKIGGKRCAAVLLSALMGLFMAGCGGSGADRGTVPGAPAASASSTSRYVLSLQVRDEAGSAVSYAEVGVVSGEGGVTGEDGRITLPVQEPPAAGQAVQVSVTRSAYYPAWKTITLYPDEHDNGVYEYNITMRGMPVDPDQATQAYVDHGNGSRTLVMPALVTDPQSGGRYAQTSVELSQEDRAVTFFTSPMNGAPDVSITFGSADGSGPGAVSVLGGAGRYTAAMTYGNPAIQSDADIFPGSFITSSDTGNGIQGQGALVTAGFAYIDVQDAAGKPVREFAPGTSATIRMRVPAGVQNPETRASIAAGNSIPVFFFDETAGQWVVEHNPDGSVMKTTVQQDARGLFVSFQVTHLTWWNLDFKTSLCESGKPTVWIVDASGNPVTGATVYADINGWLRGITLNDDVVKFYEVSRDVTWRVWASKDNLVSSQVTIKNCVDDATGQPQTQLVLDTPCPVACTTNADCAGGGAVWPLVDVCSNAGSCNAVCTKTCSSVNWCASCDDGDPATLDVCQSNSLCGGACFSCIPTCRAHADCDDFDPATEDICASPDTCYAYCINQTPECQTDTDCDDSKAATLDVCAYAGNPYAYCENCEPACYSSTECDDGNAATREFCRNPGSCIAKCIIYEPLCFSHGDCNDGNAATLDACYAAGSQNAECVHCEPACRVNTDCDDLNAQTIDTCSLPGECNARCNSCLVACASDSACDDGNPGTDDTCRNPGKCQAYCTNNCHITCRADTDCDDGNAATLDVCGNPGTCSAACASCVPLCSTDADCGDSNPATMDICTNPGTCQAACTHPLCSPLCSSDTVCDDGNPGTVDVCVNPGTCQSACQNKVPPHWEMFPPGNAVADPFFPDISSYWYFETRSGIHAALDSAGNLYMSWGMMWDPLSPGPIGDGWLNFVYRWDGAQMQNISEGLNGDPSVYNDVYSDPFVLPGVNGGLYLGLYKENAILMRQWDGTRWNASGPDLLNHTLGTDTNPLVIRQPALCASPSGTAFALWVERTAPVVGQFRESAYLAGWSGAGWTLYGGGPVFERDNSVVIPTLFCGRSGNAFLTFTSTDGAGGSVYQVYVLKWTGAAIEEVGAGSSTGQGISNASAGAYSPALAEGQNGYPMVAWAEMYNNAPYLYIKRWTGSQWEPMGAGAASGAGLASVYLYPASAESFSPIAVQADALGNAYVAWPATPDSDGQTTPVYVRKWTGSAWEEMPAGSASGSGIWSRTSWDILSQTMILDAGGIPYLFWYGINPNAYSMRWNPGN